MHVVESLRRRVRRGAQMHAHRQMAADGGRWRKMAADGEGLTWISTGCAAKWPFGAYLVVCLPTTACPALPTYRAGPGHGWGR